MTDEERVLRKCKILELDDKLSYFICSDLSDHSLKQVFLSGSQMMNYKTYALGDKIYACKSSIGEWKLVIGAQFKRSIILSRLKKELDHQLD